MGDKLHVMIIDDEPIVGKRLKRLLEKEDFVVETFTRGSLAIEELSNKHFDIIITDLMMGIVDGIQILEFAKTSYPDVRVIIITGFGKKETSEEAFRKGAFDFIIKPFRVEELREVVHRAAKELKAG